MPMDALALSPRWIASPPRRALRSPAPPAACVDVQWTFLPTQPPSRLSNSQQQPPAKISGSLHDAYDCSQAREELQIEQLRLRRSQDAADQQQQRVLYDLMGETQRKAMLDKVMAEMEAMTLTPIRRFGQNRHHPGKPSPVPSATTRRSSMAHAKARADDVALLPQRRLSALGDDECHDDDDEVVWSRDDDNGIDSNDANDQEDGGDASEGEELDLPELRAIRERHRQRVQGKTTPNARVHDSHILWQKSSHVRMALDLPPALAGFDGQDDGSNECDALVSPLSDLFPLSMESVREQQRYLTRRASKIQEKSPSKSPKTKMNATSPGKANFTGSPSLTGLTRQSTSPKRVRRAHYGSWYVPRDEWWPQHQTEQDALADLYPEETPPPLERHQCDSSLQDDRPQKAPVLPQPDHPYRWPNVLRAPIRTATQRPSISRPPTSTGSVLATPNAAGMSSPRISYITPRSPDSSHHGKGGPVLSPRGSISSDPITQRAIELQNEIPQAYIAREYRNYLLAKGARVPSYLNY